MLLRLLLPVADATEGVLPKSALQPAAEPSERVRTETHFTEIAMSTVTSLSAYRAVRLHDFIWSCLRAVEPSTVDMHVVDGVVWTRNSRGWSSLGDSAGWLRLARALGALRSK